MYVQIPAINSESLNVDQISLMTKDFIEDQREQLELFARIIFQLQDTESLKEVLQLIEAESHHDLDFTVLFGEDNDPHEYILDKLRYGYNQEATLNLFREKYPIAKLVNDFGELDIEFIENASELDFHELYPLYSKPSPDQIHYCLKHMQAIAFFEVGGNYFMGLTTSGSDQNDKIAYQYLTIDGYIPHNYISRKKHSYYGLTSEQENVINTFLDKEAANYE